MYGELLSGIACIQHYSIMFGGLKEKYVHTYVLGLELGGKLCQRCYQN
jgi:hypothetical protein